MLILLRFPFVSNLFRLGRDQWHVFFTFPGQTLLCLLCHPPPSFHFTASSPGPADSRAQEGAGLLFAAEAGHLPVTQVVTFHVSPGTSCLQGLRAVGFMPRTKTSISKRGQWQLNLAGNWGHAWKERETLFPNWAAHWRHLFLINEVAWCSLPTQPSTGDAGLP